MLFDGEVMRRDVFPAEVAMPNGTVLTKVRVFVTSHRLLVYSTDADRQIQLASDQDLTEINCVPGDRSTLRPGAGALECKLAGGSAWVNASPGCGCGSPLKALAPPVPWVRARAA